MKNIILSSTLLLSILFSVAQSTETSPRVVFGDLKHNGPYDRSEILLQEKLTVSSGDGNTYQVISYKLTISPATGRPTRFEVQGNKLPAKLQGALNQIVGGDKILIESVFAMVNEDKYDIRMLSPIELVLKSFESDGPYNTSYGDNGKTTIDSLLQATLGIIEADGSPHSLEEILKQTEIGVKSPKGLDYVVQSFKLITARKSAPASMATSNSNQITESMTAMLSKLQSGDRILVEGIRAQVDVEGKTIRANLSPVIITVL